MDSIWQAYAAIMVAAVGPIWLGAHASVTAPRPKKKPGEAKAKEGEESESDEEEVDRLTKEDAYWFPVMGSAVLLGLFFVFKYLDPRLINLLLSSYFALLGSAGIGRMLTSFTRSAVGTQTFSTFDTYRFRLTRNASDVLFSLRFTSWDVGYLFLGIAVAAAEVWTKHWALTNFVALSFAFNAVSLLKLDGFKTGAILLGGLFLYDIWWVFGSSHAFGENVMVSVAKSFEAPIKIVWPKSIRALLSGDKTGFTMLGLGDIVIPGVFVASALRFDHHLALLSSPPSPSSSSSPKKRRKLDRYPRPYFLACLAAYVGGLATTILVMHCFQAAQPALLYLSPACTGSVLGLAAVKGEWSRLWNWEDGDDPFAEQKQEEEKHPDQVDADGQRKE